MLDALSRLPPEIAVFIIGLLTALAVLGWSMLTLIHGPRAKIARRLAEVAGKDRQRPGSRSSSRLPKRKSIQVRLKEVEEKEGGGRAQRLREELTQAGLRIEIWHYLAGCALACVGAFLVARMSNLGPGPSLLLSIIGGIGLPKLMLGILAKRRINKFVGQFAESIDLVVRGIRSGLPLGECINMIGREVSAPLGTEFLLITENQKLGLGLQEALARAVERMPIPELRYFAIVIAIQQQTGGNLAETLAKLSEVLRARKRMRDKIQAYSSEAKASAYIIGSLPLFVMAALTLVAPDYLSILFTTDAGNAMLFGGGLTEVVGVLVMRKMINFDM